MVLLDEPTLGLDPKTCELVFQTTQTINELGATVLMVEQNVRFGLKLATDGVVMERGRVLLAEPADSPAGPTGHGGDVLRHRPLDRNIDHLTQVLFAPPTSKGSAMTACRSPIPPPNAVN